MCLGYYFVGKFGGYLGYCESFGGKLRCFVNLDAKLNFVVIMKVYVDQIANVIKYYIEKLLNMVIVVDK